MIRNICVIGVGAIGSIYAAHLARICEVYAFVRRPEHAEAINRHGITVSGTHRFSATLKATTQVSELPQFDLGIVATKATQTESAFGPVGHLFDQGAVISAQNGLGSEELMAQLTQGFIIRATTFMNGTRESDSAVHYNLATPTWMGPFEGTKTPFERVQEAADLIIESGLKAEALTDARPAQWAKLIFNSSVNAVAALTGLPHCQLFAKRERIDDLGHLLFSLIEEGKAVADQLGIELKEDPWEMNKIGASSNHPTSMLYDMQHHYASEIDFLCGAIAREAQEAGVEAPLHSALYQLVKGKEASWNWDTE